MVALPDDGMMDKFVKQIEDKVKKNMPDYEAALRKRFGRGEVNVLVKTLKFNLEKDGNEK